MGFLKGFSDAGNAWMQAESGGTPTPVSTTPPPPPAKQSASPSAPPPAQATPAKYSKWDDPTIEENGHTRGFNNSRKQEQDDAARADANRQRQRNIVYVNYEPPTGDRSDPDHRDRPQGSGPDNGHQASPPTSNVSSEHGDNDPAGSEVNFHPGPDAPERTMQAVSNALKAGGGNRVETTKKIQEMLEKAGYTIKGGHDEKFGASTQAALADYIEHAGGDPKLINAVKGIDVSKNSWMKQNEELSKALKDGPLPAHGASAPGPGPGGAPGGQSPARRATSLTSAAGTI